MALAEGTRVYVLYDLPPPDLYHERLIMAACACGRGWHIVLSPDFDMFAEQISLENDDLTAYRVGVGLELPAGIGAGNAYRFRDLPGAAEMTQFRRDARHAAAAMSVPPGGGPGVVAPIAGGAPVALPVVAAGDGGAGGEDYVWVRVESEAGGRRGDLAALDGTEIIHGAIGLKPQDGIYYAIKRMKRSEVEKYKGKEASSDARLMGLTFQGLSRTERQWRDVSKEIQQETIEDWSVPGPRTSDWCIRFLNRRNGGPSDHHRWWAQNHALKPEAWGVGEHDHLMKVVDKLGRFDGLDLANLAGAELIFRRLQLIEYVYSERGPGGGKGQPKGDKKNQDAAQSYEATIFAGGHKEFGDTMVAPQLLEYVAKEVEGEAAVMKQVRKAREERSLAAKQ